MSGPYLSSIAAGLGKARQGHKRGQGIKSLEARKANRLVTRRSLLTRVLCLALRVPGGPVNPLLPIVAVPTLFRLEINAVEHGLLMESPF